MNFNARPTSVTLLLRPPPSAGESACGYGLRLACENRLDGLFDLLVVIGLTPSMAAALGPQAMHEVASGRVLTRAEFEAARKKSDRISGRGEFVLTTRMCPACLGAEGFWRAKWEDPLAIACEAHGVNLVDQCEHCGRWLSHRGRNSLFHCRCGHDFRLSRASNAPNWLGTFEAVFRPWLNNPSMAADREQVIAMERGAAIAVMCLCREAGYMPGMSARSSGGRRLRMRSTDHPALAKLVNDWPDGLRRALLQRVAAMSVEQRSTFADVLRTSPLPLIKREAEVILSQFAELSRQRNAPYIRPTPPGPGLVTLGTLTNAMGVAESLTGKLFDSGQLSRATVSLARRVKWIDAEELQVALLMRRDAPALSEAAKFLNCPDDVLLALSRAGFLRTVVDPRVPGLPRFRIDDLVALVAHLENRAERIIESLKMYIPITSVLPFSKKRRLSEAWIRLFDRIRLRGIPLAQFDRPDLALGNFAVLRSDVSQIDGLRLNQ